MTGAGNSRRADLSLPRVVGAAIVDDLARPTRLLSARRIGPPELAGMWEFPGGKMEAGETPQAALIREVSEELGVAIVVGDALGTVPLAKPGWLMDVFSAQVTDGQPAVGEDHDALTWLGPQELYDVSWIPADLPVVDRIAAWMGWPTTRG